MHYQFRILHFSLKKNLKDVYANLFLKTFALSLIGLFVPLYLLYEIGLSFNDVLIFYLAFFTLLAIGYPLGAYFVPKIGLKKIIMLSVPFHLSYYLLLYLLKIRPIPIILIAGVQGLAEGLFWFAYNTNFSRFSDKKHRGEEVDIFYVLATVIGVFGPFVGGALLSFMGFHVVFLVVIALLLLSVLPLTRVEERGYKKRVYYTDVFHKRNYSLSSRIFLQGVRHTVTGIFWPIFVFSIINEYFSLGAVFSVASLFSSLVIWRLGSKIDSVNKYLLNDFSSIVHGIVSFVKIFIENIVHAFGVAIVSMISYGSSEISLDAMTFDKANKTKNVQAFFIYRECILFLGRLFVILILFFSGLDMISNLKLSFGILGGVSLIEGISASGLLKKVF